MNMGPPDHCVLCGLALEPTDHLLRSCMKAKLFGGWWSEFIFLHS